MMYYPEYTIGGELFHGERANHKYIDKVKTKSGNWRYIYDNYKKAKSKAKKGYVPKVDESKMSYNKMKKVEAMSNDELIDEIGKLWDQGYFTLKNVNGHEMLVPVSSKTKLGDYDYIYNLYSEGLKREFYDHFSDKFLKRHKK